LGNTYCDRLPLRDGNYDVHRTSLTSGRNENYANRIVRRSGRFDGPERLKDRYPDATHIQLFASTRQKPMKIRVLGSAAGGGFPQWNCNCRNCNGQRSGRMRTHARTQSSIAICGADPFAWTLINASPDILQQLRDAPLQPARSLRDSSLTAIVLTDAQIDHVAGLSMLREATQPWPLWCTDGAYRDLTESNPLIQVLSHYCGVQRRSIELHRSFDVDGLKDVGLTALPVLGKAAPYSPRRTTPGQDDTIALRLIDKTSGHSIVYAPALGAMDPTIWETLSASQCVLIDGTFWTDDEMIHQGLSRRSAREMGHLPQTGAGGMLEWLERLPSGVRKILIHINNTNPILDEDSPERELLGARGIEVAFDGMEIEL
jgi:pyrroloquinoline quinone biosynthesis protein B